MAKLKENQPNFDPKKVNVDFDVASTNAAIEVFPNAMVQGCNFQLKQTVIRNLDAVGLKKRYETDVKFAHEVREMTAKALLCYVVFSFSTSE